MASNPEPEKICPFVMSPGLLSPLPKVFSQPSKATDTKRLQQGAAPSVVFSQATLPSSAAPCVVAIRQNSSLTAPARLV